MLLAIFGVSLLGAVSQWRIKLLLANYLSSRVELKTALEILNENPCWKDLKSRSRINDPPTRWSLKRILDVKCEANKSTIVSLDLDRKPRSTQAKISSAGAPPPGLPNAPGGLSVSVSTPMPATEFISDSLEKLSDDKMLEDARAGSWLYNHSIYKWILFRNNLRVKQSGKPIALIDLPMEDIFELSKYELPRVETSALQELRDDVTLFPATAKVSLFLAIDLVETSLLVLYLYFWLSQRQAMNCETFPTKGTLFGIFYQDRFSKVCFMFLVLSPAAVGGYLAWASLRDTYLSSGLSVLTMIFSILVALPIARALNKR